MNTAELQKMIDGITGAKFSGRKSRVWNLKNYIEWCETNGFHGANTNSIKGISHQVVEKIREKTVKSPFHMQAYLNSIFVPEKLETVDNAFRCYLWLAYAGIPENDSLDISIADNTIRIFLYHLHDFVIQWTYKSAV